MLNAADKQSVESIKPFQGDNRDKGTQVREMFDNIAPTYDTLNRTMTMGIDRLWRKKTIKKLKKLLPNSQTNILDIATGTGDLLLEMAKQLPNAEICGIDLSEGMLNVCRHKINKASIESRVKVEIADCLHLPYADNSYDSITCAFGVRNFEHLLEGYKEMHRVLRPGAYACILEISNPENKMLLALYRLYTMRLIPLIGKLVSKDADAYRYLPESVSKVPQGKDMLNIMQKAGFEHCTLTRFTFGACTLYMAQKSFQ